MPFVKLDCAILNSTIWVDRLARELFITALLMAEPFDTAEALPQIAIGSLDLTGWSVPPGWYGFVPAASTGLIHRAGFDKDDEDVLDAAMEALRRLGEPEPESRSPAYDGRRLVRVDGGFVVLNFMKYREKDTTTADRSRRWRERKKANATRRDDTATRVIRHQAEAEAEAEAEVPSVATLPQVKTKAEPLAALAPSADASAAAFEDFWQAYPRKVGKADARRWWTKHKPTTATVEAMGRTLAWQTQSEQWLREGGQFIPHPATWLNQGRWDDEPTVAGPMVSDTMRYNLAASDEAVRIIQELRAAQQEKPRDR